MKNLKTYKQLFEYLVVELEDCDYNLIKKELENGADVNQILDNYFETPLTFAIRTYSINNQRECINIIDLLLEYDADVNKHDDLGNTPLIISIDTNFDLMCKLIDAGADWNLPDYDGDYFIELIDDDDIKKSIIEKYPEKYEEYKKWEKAKEFNL